MTCYAVIDTNVLVSSRRAICLTNFSHRNNKQKRCCRMSLTQLMP